MPRRDQEIVRCPECKQEVSAAAKAETGYVLLVPCGCKGFGPEYSAVYEKLVGRVRH